MLRASVLERRRCFGRASRASDRLPEPVDPTAPVRRGFQRVQVRFRIEIALPEVSHDGLNQFVDADETALANDLLRLSPEKNRSTRLRDATALDDLTHVLARLLVQTQAA